jgi:hypothetical protein
MSDVPAITADFPRLLPGRPGTSTEGRLFIGTRKGDERAAVRLREAGGLPLREKGEALIWGFPPETVPSELEALCENLRHADTSDQDHPCNPAAEGWNFDINAAPRGKEKVITGKVAGVHEYERRVHARERIFAAGTGGVVTVSYWIPEHERWCMFTKAVPPMAWRPYEEGATLPRHPLGA